MKRTTEELKRALDDAESALRLAAYHGVPLPRQASDVLRKMKAELATREATESSVPDVFGVRAIARSRRD